MSRNKALSLDDDAPAADVVNFIGKPPEAIDEQELSAGWNEALLASDDHRSFIEQAIEKPGETRDAYLIGRNRYVLIDPALKRALDVVKEARKASAEHRRSFLRN